MHLSGICRVITGTLFTCDVDRKWSTPKLQFKMLTGHYHVHLSTLHHFIVLQGTLQPLQEFMWQNEQTGILHNQAIEAMTLECDMWQILGLEGLGTYVLVECSCCSYDYLYSSALTSDCTCRQGTLLLASDATRSFKFSQSWISHGFTSQLHKILSLKYFIAHPFLQRLLCSTWVYWITCVPMHD